MFNHGYRRLIGGHRPGCGNGGQGFCGYRELIESGQMDEDTDLKAYLQHLETEITAVRAELNERRPAVKKSKKK